MMGSSASRTPAGSPAKPELRTISGDAISGDRGASSDGVASISPAVATSANARWWQAARALLAGQFDRAAVKNVRREALAVFSIRVLSAALLFASQIILARWIGASGYGLYVALWSAVLVAGGLSHLGLSTAMMRLVPEYRASNAHDTLRGLLTGGRFIAFSGGLLSAIVL
jgi:hypothetical protein